MPDGTTYLNCNSNEYGLSRIKQTEADKADFVSTGHIGNPTVFAGQERTLLSRCCTVCELC